MDEPDFGKLVWAKVDNYRGQPTGQHCAIILTSKAEYAATQQLEAVVISSSLRDTKSDCMVMMPWGRPQHPQTGFDRKCAAICCWVVKLKESDIDRYGNRIYGSLLRKVVDCVQKAKAAKKSSTQS